MSRCSKCGAPEFTQEKLKGLVKRDFKLEKENKFLQELNKRLNEVLDARDNELIEKSGKLDLLQTEIQERIKMIGNSEWDGNINHFTKSVCDGLATLLKEVKK